MRARCTALWAIHLRRALRVRVLLAAGLDVARARARIAHPVGVGVRRDRAPQVRQVEQGRLGRRVRAVLVPGHDHAADLVVERVLAGLVAVVVRAVEAFDHHLRDRAPHPEPDRRADADDVGREHLLEDARPLVALALVGADAEPHRVVGDAHDLGLDVHRVPPVLDLAHQRFGVGHLRGVLQRAVQHHGLEARHVVSLRSSSRARRRPGRNRYTRAARRVTGCRRARAP